MWRICVLLIISVTSVSASCPTECQCPPGVPVCAAGVSLTFDSCGCCKVCARQLFEDCSDTQPCDTAKGLECNFGGGSSSAKGVCQAKSDGRSCEFNSRIYQNGETFQPNCKHQCTCMDGSVGCVSLCPQELSLSKLGCAKPRRVKVLGRCCEQLICLDDAKLEMGRSTRRKHKDKKSEDDLIVDTNDLVPEWRKKLKLPPALRSQSLPEPAGVQCSPQTVSCSELCGSEISKEANIIPNKCKLETQTQICESQPCRQTTSKKAQKCKATHPIKLSYTGCCSLKKLQLRLCGSCSDGRYCRTPTVCARCRNGQILRRKVTGIEFCMCGFKHSSRSKRTRGPHRFFLKDTHKQKP
ncbi:CCN family member 1-like [Kryptolebias marmoratus]|uniref:Cellular communication network factor 1 n=1 Tax=Kryptolebias marmoratus TaxID=37003 RepID=A0A3Q2ZJJ0_KRYMA|nr:CCN family member 1-like [Kryptolebias marmoratus]